MNADGARKPSLIRIEPLKPASLTAEYVCWVHVLTEEGFRTNSSGSFKMETLSQRNN